MEAKMVVAEKDTERQLNLGGLEVVENTSAFPLIARIAGWLLLSITVGLSVIVAIALGIMLNRAPFHQVTTVFLVLVIIYTVCFFVLVIASLIYYPKGTVEDIVSSHENTRTDASKNALRSGSLMSRVFFCSRKEIVAVMMSLIVMITCIFLGTALMFPEAYRNTFGLRIQKLGSVESTSARFFLRDSSVNLSHVLQYRLGNGNLSLEWTSVLFDVDPERDFTKYISVTGLLPSTTYLYRFDEAADKEFNFTTPPLANSSAKFSFYFGSCFLYNVPNLQPAQGWRNVDKVLSIRDPSRSFVMFMGDFIYSDHPWYKGDSKDVYSTLYRQVYTNPYIETTLSKYPSFYIFDDHEIYDNWDKKQAEPYPNAMHAWNSFLGLGNPRNESIDEAENVHYYDFTYGDTAFFVLDSRSHRSANDEPDGPSKTMLGAAQKQRLFNWLLETNTTAVFKFLVSSVGWTTKLAKDTDGWGKGFPTERKEVFDFIRSNGITGCVFLSADSHFVYGALELDHNNSGLYEFSSSPLNAFTGSGFGKVGPADVTSGNETVEFSNTGNGAFVSLLGVIDVDTSGAEPHFNVSFYQGGEQDLLYQVKMNISDVTPK